MKLNKLFLITIFSSSLLMLNTSCQNLEKKEEVMEEKAEMTTDLAAIKTEIQSIENQWADAINSKNTDAIMAIYSDDVISMPEGMPSIKGKAELRKHQEAEFANSKSESKMSFETLEVFSDGNNVMEIGTSTTKNTAGEVIKTGKYMAFFEKKDGKYLCTREIYNSDAKE
jgi:ketosteroid isomerase-like protein